MTSDDFHRWLDSIEELDIIVPTESTFQIIILLDHTFIASETMWEILTIPTSDLKKES